MKLEQWQCTVEFSLLCQFCLFFASSAISPPSKAVVPRCPGCVAALWCCCEVRQSLHAQWAEHPTVLCRMAVLAGSRLGLHLRCSFKRWLKTTVRNQIWARQRELHIPLLVTAFRNFIELSVHCISFILTFEVSDSASLCVTFLRGRPRIILICVYLDDF